MKATKNRGWMSGGENASGIQIPENESEGVMGELSILDRTGDSRLQWSKTHPGEIEAAETRFNELRGKGYVPFKVDASGSKGEQMVSFDPAVERVIMVPPMVGG